ncbi:MAG: Uma2 family endonuclease [Desulfamplus sp.]|nr:Uma2 family endonuclease [Desulfamplus sp.]MBF0243084.1 Uma2 family endonuclease [Desulfamplus sp.]
MSQLATQQHYYTKEEYLLLEESAEYKSEYYNGEIFAMAGGTRNHSAICLNVNWSIREAILNKDCIGFDSNMKLDIPTHNIVVYPDAMVACSNIEFLDKKETILKNPLLVIEVLSPSTEHVDRIKKFIYYQSVPSIQEYIMISQAEPKVEAYYKQNERNWLYTIVKGLDETIYIKSLEYEIVLKELYQKVKWR